MKQESRWVLPITGKRKLSLDDLQTAWNLVWSGRCGKSLKEKRFPKKMLDALHFSNLLIVAEWRSTWNCSRFTGDTIQMD